MWLDQTIYTEAISILKKKKRYCSKIEELRCNKSV